MRKNPLLATGALLLAGCSQGPVKVSNIPDPVVETDKSNARVTRVDTLADGEIREAVLAGNIGEFPDKKTFTEAAIKASTTHAIYDKALNVCDDKDPDFLAKAGADAHADTVHIDMHGTIPDAKTGKSAAVSERYISHECPKRTGDGFVLSLHLEGFSGGKKTAVLTKNIGRFPPTGEFEFAARRAGTGMDALRRIDPICNGEDPQWAEFVKGFREGKYVDDVAIDLTGTTGSHKIDSRRTGNRVTYSCGMPR